MADLPAGCRSKMDRSFKAPVEVYALNHCARQLGFRQLIPVPVYRSSLNGTAPKRFNLLSRDGVVRICVSNRLMTKKVSPSIWGGSAPDAPSMSPAARDNYDRMRAACYLVIASSSLERKPPSPLFEGKFDHHMFFYFFTFPDFYP